jgi:DNA-binding transcriptional regulator YbjK
VTAPVPALRDQLTPNQLHKRRQIIDAAKHVLATGGLARCTAREIAAAGPLTKSAIHYYFADMDLLIDLAMSEHVAAFLDQLRAAGADEPDPAAAFWRTVDAYLGTFRDRPEVTHLWFEYWTDASRKDRLRAVRDMLGQTSAVFADRLRATGAPAADDAARAVLVYLMGAIVDQAAEPRARHRTRDHVARLAGLGPG